eukprot:Sspe_Gene.15132::Locus_5254_Transcript_2_4_Confidence_0.500_Length_961::g.15132::m.15132
MGCGSSTVPAVAEPATSERRRSNNNNRGVEEEHRREESRNDPILIGRLDELVARLLYEEELVQLQIYNGNTAANSETPKEKRGLTSDEINNHSSIILLSSQCGDADVPDPPPDGVFSQECIMCLEEYSVGDKARMLPCHHYYHSKCIEDWLKRSRTCPLCQCDITTRPKPPSILDPSDFPSSSAEPHPGSADVVRHNGHGHDAMVAPVGSSPLLSDRLPLEVATHS